MKVIRILIVLGAMASLLAVETPAGQNAASLGNAENGKKIFSAYGCYHCHGYVGQGGAAGARLNPVPLSWPNFTKYVRHPSGQMPPYTAKVVTDQELADIYAYLQSIPKPPDVKSIPILNN
jgi:ubiquinol-cytochrome c reductase cytochrome c subunit